MFFLASEFYQLYQNLNDLILVIVFMILYDQPLLSKYLIKDNLPLNNCSSYQKILIFNFNYGP